MAHSYWSLGPVCWKHSSQSACSSSPRVPAPPPLRPSSAFPLVEVDPRVQRTHFFTALGVVWRQIRGAGIGSQISPTLSNLAVTLIERPWSMYLSRSSDSTKFSSSCNQVRRQPFCHCTEAPSSGSSVQRCLQTWTFMVVQSNWSWLPAILLLGFYVDVSERTIISAGTLRLRLSGLKSRAHLIREYSFPSCQAQSSLHALSRLYVQKGFALSDIHSALWPTNTSGDRPLCVGSTPVSKGFAIFSVFQFFNFKAGGRPTCTADSLFHSTWCCMAPNQGRRNRKSDFSDTFELGRDAYREIVEQYLSRSSDSTKIFIILQSGTSTAFLSLYRSTIFKLQCSKCLQTWTFMGIVQSKWSWLPTILLLGFYVDVSERNNHFQPEPSDCVWADWRVELI